MNPLLRFLLGLIGLLLLLPGACGVIIILSSLDSVLHRGYLQSSDGGVIIILLALGALGVWLLVRLRRA